MQNLDEIVLEPAEPGKILGVDITVEEIQEKIAKLSGLPKDNLKGAMAELKTALKFNPEAANLLLPEEIGQLTAAIYRMTEQIVIKEAAKATVKASKKVDIKNIKEMPSDF